MIRLATLALADWMADPDLGPNAFLPAVAVDPLDETLTLAPIAVVFDPFRNDEACALLTEPGRYPALYVLPDGPLEFEGEVNQDQLDAATLAFRMWLLLEENLTPRGNRIASYYLTAINRALSAFCAETVAARAARERESCQLITCTSRTYAITYDDVGSSKRLGVALLATFTARNTEAD